MSGVAVILVALLAQLDRFKFRFLTGRSAFLTNALTFEPAAEVKINGILVILHDEIDNEPI